MWYSRTRIYRIKSSVPKVQNNRRSLVYIGFRICRINFAVRRHPIYPTSTVFDFHIITILPTVFHVEWWNMFIFCSWPVSRTEWCGRWITTCQISCLKWTAAWRPADGCSLRWTPPRANWTPSSGSRSKSRCAQVGGQTGNYHYFEGLNHGVILGGQCVCEIFHQCSAVNSA